MSHLKTHLEYIRNTVVTPALLEQDWCPDLRLLTLEGEQIATGAHRTAEQPIRVIQP